MMKLTAQQLTELFNVTARGERLERVLDPLYGLKLELGELSEEDVKKILTVSEHKPCRDAKILSLQRLKDHLHFLSGIQVQSKMTTSIGESSGRGSDNPSFSWAFDVVYQLLNIQFPSHGKVFEKIGVRESNLWQLTQIFFKNSLKDLVYHTCYFDYTDDRPDYVEEKCKEARRFNDLFLAGGFCVGSYQTDHHWDHFPHVPLVLVK